MTRIENVVPLFSVVPHMHLDVPFDVDACMSIELQDLYENVLDCGFK